MNATTRIDGRTNSNSNEVASGGPERATAVYNDSWRTEEVILSSGLFFESLARGIDQARSSIDLECYIFNNDELGRSVIERLNAAARRGVAVRIMVDGYGSPNWAQNFLKEVEAAGGFARIYHPMPWKVLSPLRRALPSLTRFFQLLSTINQRNHRKVCIVDRKKAWLGGMNISSSHLSWRDSGAVVEGDQVLALQIAFQEAWEDAWEMSSHLSGASVLRKPVWQQLQRKLSFNRLVRLNLTRQWRERVFNELLARIRQAKRRIWITNAYFIPPQSLLDTLEAASRGGVDVRLLVPRRPDVFFVHWVSSALYFGLLMAGVRIFEYIPTPLHAKTLLIDNWACVGSSNLNHRSIIYDLEVDVSLTTKSSIDKLVEAFDRDVRLSKEVTLVDWKKRSIWERCLGRLLLLLKRWM